MKLVSTTPIKINCSELRIQNTRMSNQIPIPSLMYKNLSSKFEESGHFSAGMGKNSICYTGTRHSTRCAFFLSFPPDPRDGAASEKDTGRRKKRE